MELTLIALAAFLMGVVVTFLISERSHKSKYAHQKEEYEQKCSRLENEKHESEIALATLSATNTLNERLLQEAKDAKKEDAEAAAKEFGEKLKNLQTLFQNAANDILKEKTKDLSSTNSEQIKNIVEPLSKKMDEFRTAVEHSKEKSIENTAAIEQKIKEMIEQTKSVGAQASNLASALKSNNKTLGNWGEVILKNLLQNMGLSEGKDFVTQEALRDADGNTLKSDENNRRMIPDVVMFLPNDKALVIDSKVSLTAFMDYSNAEDDQSRADALNRHFKSVETHVKELSEKKYSQYLRKSKKDSLDYVVMFVPNEGAFQLYYQNYAQAWHKAFEKKVIIAGESNLFAMLKIIDAAWIQITQQKNLEEVMKISGELLDRVANFVNTFDDIGGILKRSLNKFDEAKNDLTGRYSIVTTARKLEKKGVVMSKKMHESLLPPDDNDDSTPKSLPESAPDTSSDTETI